jgi:signal transduction histidine kinase
MTSGTSGLAHNWVSKNPMAPKGTFVLRLAGILTWLVVGVPHLLGRIHVPWVFAWLAFGVTYWFTSNEATHQWPRPLKIATIAAQSFFAILALWLIPNSFMPVLAVIVAGAVAGSLTLPFALAWVAAQTVAIAVVFAGAGLPAGEYLPVAGSYFAFQILALFAVHLARSESHARQELALANAELRSAADLLDASSRANERLRIARDLHDLLGHHLTALSVNLEVASHLTDGKAREHVSHAQSLAKLLLSDVRAVVSDLRDEQPIDVASMLSRILEPVPSPKIELTVQPDLRIADPLVAQTLLRAAQEIVTNAMRHSGATTLQLDVRRNDGAIELRADDDGHGVTPLRLGNGLTGIRERAEAAGGRAEYRSARGAGFHVVLRLTEELA